MAYDREFFLNLALRRKDAWNEWRHIPANKDVRVTFARNNFSESPWDEIDFSGFEFGDHADFSGCEWRGGEWQEIEDPEAFMPGRASFVGAAFGHEAKFTGANFGDQANFTRATFRHGADFIHAVLGYAATFTGAAFGHRASFAGVNFGLRAKFTGATFADEANFTGATFGDAAQFTNVIFGNHARFEGVGFGGTAYFTSATFGGDATFTGAAFGLLANFDKAHFKGMVNFTGKSPEQWARDIARASGMDEEVRAALEKRHRVSWELNGSGPERFSITSFASTRTISIPSGSYSVPAPSAKSF